MDYSLYRKARNGNALQVGLLFCFLWLLLFILYYPAAKAGFVADFTGWLEQVRYHSFREFINRTHFQAKSLYQFTQLNTYLFYKLFGVNPWAWHVLFITLHSLNACLLFILCKRLLNDTGLKSVTAVPIAGAILFCISPYISEVVVWEPAYHFLQGLLLLLLVLLFVQEYVHTGAKQYVWLAAGIYFLSVFSLEIFYITPWLVLTLGLFYHFNNPGKSVLQKVFTFFFIPLLLIFVIRLVGYRIYSGDWVSRIGSGAVAVVTAESFGKPAKYLFHLLALGRFFPEHAAYPYYDRSAIYAFCDSFTGLCIFYATVLLALVQIIRRFRRMSGKGKVASLLFLWMIVALLLLAPLWFPAGMLVAYDRYLYFAGAFFYMLVPVIVYFIPIKYLRWALLAAFAALNLRFAIMVSRYWGKSGTIVNSLLHTIPDSRDKKILLLNVPQSMHGVPMIGAEKNSEYKLMHDLMVLGKQLTNTVYDVLAYNMNTPQDGAHVHVINDSTVKVTLNQWATWWWFETRGGYSYWTEDYKVNLIDPGHWYELTLRKPSGQFLLLYNVGDQWKEVDMSRKGVEQD